MADIDSNEERGRTGQGRPASAWPAVAAVLVIAALGCSSSASRQQAQTAPPSAVSSAQVRQPAEIRALELVPEGGGASLSLVADRPLVWTSFRDAQGDLVIELPNSVPRADVADLANAQGLVASVEVERLDDAERPLTRLVVRTRTSSEHSLAGEGDTLRIELFPVDQPVEQVAEIQQPTAQQPTAQQPTAQQPTAQQHEAQEPAALAYEPLPEEEPVAEEMAAVPPPSTQRVGTVDAPFRAPPPTGVAASQLRAVEVESAGSGTVVTVAGDGEFAYSTFRLENPERFVIDLDGVVNTSSASVVTVGGGFVDQVRVGQFKPRPDPVSRVVFDLARAVVPQIERTGDGLRVSFGAGGVAPATTLAEEIGAEEPVESAESTFESGAPSAEEPAAAEPMMEEPVATAELDEMDAGAEPIDGEGAVAAEPEPAYTIAQQQPEPEKQPEKQAPAEPAVPVYTPPPPAAAAPPPLTPPPPAALKQPAVARPMSTSDVALFEAQEVQVEPPAERVNPVLQSFGTLVVSHQDREYVGEPLDMSLRQADLVETLRSFATISDLNFVIQPGVTGSVTVELKGVPWDQAMEQILKINNLGMDIDGTIVRIAPMAQLRAEAEERRQLDQARQQSVPLSTVLKSLSYSRAQDVATLLRNRTGSIMSARGTVQVDERTNTLIIRELPGAIDTVLAVIENLDAPEPQVTIEARIIEATKSFSRTLGIEWGYDLEANQANGNTTGLQFPNNVDSDGRVPLLTGGATGFINMRLGSILDTFVLDARLQVAENEGLVNLVAAPRVTTLNNTPASIQSGVQIPIQTVSNRTVSVQFVNATLQLEVTPQVTAEGTIMMDIQVAKRSPAPGLAIVGATNSPIQTREARTKVIVRDGGTTVIGGIYQVSANNSEDRVPGLANIPILGHLFKNKNKSNTNDELMIFITPRIVQM